MRMHTRAPILAVAAMTALTCTPPADDGDDVGPDDGGAALYVKTASGWLHGEYLRDAGVRRFAGIPYARPPVGELRWKAPQDPMPWAGTREAVTDGNHCPQPDTSSRGTIYGTPGGKEDCLFLNVYAPRDTGRTLRPVVVWIHGGAFYMGRANGYTPYSLVGKGAVFVSMNYRLGTLGFLAHEAFADSDGHYGNYGILDQIKALQWVRANIARFGGDPNNVTIAGQSAGAANVLTLAVSPLAAGLFHKAIVQSGGLLLEASARKALTAHVGAPGPANLTIDVEKASAAMAVAKLGCSASGDLAACLRGLSAEFIAEHQVDSLTHPYGPAVDGYVLPDFPETLLQQGGCDVPLLIGSTRDEYTALFALSHELTAPNPTAVPPLPRTVANSDASYYAELTAIYGAIPFPPTNPTACLFDEYLAGLLGPSSPSPYPLSAYDGNVSSALSASMGDAGIVCTTRKAAKLVAAATSARPVYYYEFSDRGAPMYLQPLVSYPYKAYHSADLQYIFDIDSPLDATQRNLASQMVSYWYNFAATGDPGSIGGTTWPAFTATEGQILQFNPEGNVVLPDAAFSADHRCTALWTAPL